MEIEPDAISVRCAHVFQHYGLKMKPRRKLNYEIDLTGSEYVYAVQCNEFIKIGIASNVFSRLNSLQVGNPYEVRLLCYWRTASSKDTERRLHDMLAKYHVRGEWFNPPQEVIETIKHWKVD